MDFIIGADVGQSIDPFAFTIVQRKLLSTNRETNEDEYKFNLVWVEQMPLNTEYEIAIDRLEAFVTDKRLSGRVQVAMDRSSVGRPIIETARKRPALAEILWGITSTPGRKESREKNAPMNFAVPKKDLTGHLQLALQRRRLKWNPRCPWAAELKKQLLVYTGDKRKAIVGFGTSPNAHDDIIMALCNAIWLSSYIPYEEDDTVDDNPWNSDVPVIGESSGVLIEGLKQDDRPAPSWRDNLGNTLGGGW